MKLEKNLRLNPFKNSRQISIIKLHTVLGRSIKNKNYQSWKVIDTFRIFYFYGS
jgi:hypothetical protein